MPKQEDPILKELKTINKELFAVKKLVMLSLYANNIPAEEIGKTIEMKAKSIRNMFSKKTLKKAKIRVEIINEKKQK